MSDSGYIGMSGYIGLSLEIRAKAVQARIDGMKAANIQDSNGAAYTPDHFFSAGTELEAIADQLLALVPPL